MTRKPSSQPMRPDRKRSAQLDPVQTAVEKLNLPLLRLRKINAILNAVAMQIEDGGDSPEVNRHLLDALKAAILYQVGEHDARPALSAIAQFEQAEVKHWEQAKAGTLPLLELTFDEQLDDLIQDGYGLLETRQTVAACEKWLQAWELVKQLTSPKMRNTAAFDQAHPLTQAVESWCADLEAELRNAGVDNPVHHEQRLRFASEFMARFPEMDTLSHINFTRAQGEALWETGRHEESESVYAALVKRFPDEGWAYIGWSDNYWLIKSAPKNYAKAEVVLQHALARSHLQDRADVLERLRSLYREWGNPDREAAVSADLKRLRVDPYHMPVPAALSPIPAVPSSKPHRNDPCWCGSGRKYKWCHLKSDLKK